MRLTKRRLALAFFLFTGLSLFAQTFREAKIYIPPVVGTGTMEDNAFFYKQLAYEVVLQYHSLVRSRYGSDFILKGTIEPYTGEEQLIVNEPISAAAEVLPAGPVPSRPIPSIRNTFGRREFFSWEVEGNLLFFDTTGEGNYNPEKESEDTPIEEPEPVHEDFPQDTNEFVFILELIETSTGETVGRQYLIYSNVDASVGDLVSVVVYYMLAGIPDIVEIDDWRYKWLFLDVSGIWSPRIYAGQNQSVYIVNFGLALQAEYHFLDFLSVELGLQLVQDRAVSADGGEYRDLVLEMPLAFKFVFKPLNNLMLEPYLGGSFNLSLMGTTRPFPISGFLGFQFGIKAGPGMITADPRFSIDFGNSVVPESPFEYQRFMIQLGVGYKFGFFPKITKPQDY